jgi:general secretion pathway protein N
VTALALPALRLNHVLCGVAVLLAGLAVWPWLFGPSPARTAAGAGTEAASSAPSLPVLPPLAKFSAISERPLFSPSRKPAPGAKAAPAGPGIEQRYRLLGLINTGSSRRALLAEGKRRFAIAEGEALEGWQVARIEHDRIVLSGSAGEAVLMLQPAATPESWADPSAAVPKLPLPQQPAAETKPQR